MSRQRTYSPDEIDTGLVYLAMATGNTRRASRKLREDGKGSIAHTTLAGWKIQHEDRYTGLVREREQVRREQMAEEVIELSQMEIDAARKAVVKLDAALDNDESQPKDLGRALRDLKLAFGIGTDKANILLDRPTTIVGHNIDLTLIGKAIAALEADIEGEAVEVDGAIAQLEAEAVADAEVVPDPELSEGTPGLNGCGNVIPGQGPQDRL